MDDRTRRFMRLASTTWFNIIKYSNFTCYFTRAQSLREISTRLSNYQNQNIGLTLLKSAPIDEISLLDNISILTNLTSLSLDSTTYGIDWIKLTALTKLKYLNIDADYPLKLAQSLIHLTSLKLDHFSLDFADVAEILALNSSVQCLEIATRARNQRDIFANMANPSILTRLKIDNVRDYQIAPENEFSMSKLINLKYLDYIEKFNTSACFPISSLTSLEDLSLMVGQQLSERFDQNINLTYLEINSKYATAQYLENISKLTKLKYLVFRTSCDSTAYQFLTALTSLCNFTLGHYARDVQATLEYLNSTQLTGLIITLETADCDPIRKLTNLQDLTLGSQVITDINCSAISLLTHLTTLILMQEVNNFDFLTHLKNLKEFVIDSMVNHQLSGIDFSSLQNLELLEGPQFDSDTFNSLVSLTNLTNLSIKLPAETNRYNYSILTRLPLREFFNLSDEANNDDTLWQALDQITTLELISQNLEYDDKLLYLTGLSRLTYLKIPYSQSMTGIHLTALTSIQKLIFHSARSIFSNSRNPTKAHIEVDNLEMHLPYLYSKQL